MAASSGKNPQVIPIFPAAIAVTLAMVTEAAGAQAQSHLFRKPINEPTTSPGRNTIAKATNNGSGNNHQL